MKSVIHRTILIALVLALALPAALAQEATCTGPTPPTPDWVVEDVNVCENGLLTIESGMFINHQSFGGTRGNLTLRNVTLRFNTTTGTNPAYLENAGDLYIYNSTVTTEDPSQDSGEFYLFFTETLLYDETTILENVTLINPGTDGGDGVTAAIKLRNVFLSPNDPLDVTVFRNVNIYPAQAATVANAVVTLENQKDEIFDNVYITYQNNNFEGFYLENTNDTEIMNSELDLKSTDGTAYGVHLVDAHRNTVSGSRVNMTFDTGCSYNVFLETANDNAFMSNSIIARTTAANCIGFEIQDSDRTDVFSNTVDMLTTTGEITGFELIDSVDSSDDTHFNGNTWSMTATGAGRIGYIYNFPNTVFENEDGTVTGTDPGSASQSNGWVQFPSGLAQSNTRIDFSNVTLTVNSAVISDVLFFVNDGEAITNNTLSLYDTHLILASDESAGNAEVGFTASNIETVIMNASTIDFDVDGGQSDYVCYFYNVHTITIDSSRCRLTDGGTDGFGLYLEGDDPSGTYNVTRVFAHNSFFDAVTSDVRFNSGHNQGNHTFLNDTFQQLDFGADAGTVTVQWYVRAHAETTLSNPVDDATVTATDNTGATRWIDTTNAQGFTTFNPSTSYITSNAGLVANLTPYNLTAVSAEFGTEVEEVDVTTSFTAEFSFFEELGEAVQNVFGIANCQDSQFVGMMTFGILVAMVVGLTLLFVAPMQKSQGTRKGLNVMNIVLFLIAITMVVWLVAGC